MHYASPEKSYIQLLELPEDVLSRKTGKGTVRTNSKLRLAAKYILTIIVRRYFENYEVPVKCPREEIIHLGFSRDTVTSAFDLLRKTGLITFESESYVDLKLKKWHCRRFSVPYPMNFYTVTDEIHELPEPLFPAKPPEGWTLDRKRASDEIARLVSSDKWNRTKAWYARNRLDCAYYHKPSIYGRIFTKYNGLNKELRKFLQCHGNPTGEADIANSQMACLTVQLTKEGITGDDVTRFKFLAGSGTIYTHFAEYLRDKGLLESLAKETETEFYKGESQEEARKAARKTAKAIFLPAVYGKDKRRKSTRVFWTYFRENFPTVHDYILRLQDTQKTEDDRRAILSRTLQRVEADIIFPVAQAVSGISIHDGIRCDVSRLSEAKAGIEEAFRKHGVSVTVTLEYNEP